MVDDKNNAFSTYPFKTVSRSYVLDHNIKQYFRVIMKPPSYEKETMGNE